MTLYKILFLDFRARFQLIEKVGTWDTGTLKMQTGWDIGTPKMRTIWDTGTLKMRTKMLGHWDIKNADRLKFFEKI